MFYLIHKPLHYTSFDVIRKLRKITGIKKMGHTGTLDPLATGCLLIATDNTTKLIPYLEKQKKTYIFTVDISKRSDSYDLASMTYECSIENIVHKEKNELISFLEGIQQQVPPKFSAIHVDGKRAYDLARMGKDFELTARSIQISDVEIVNMSMPEITIRLQISSGGYIRSLAPVIGEFFGVPEGGCITYLHREKIGHLDIKDAQSLESFDEQRYLNYPDVLTHMDHVHLKYDYKKPLQDGLVVNLKPSNAKELNSEAIIYFEDMISVCQWTEEGLRAKRNFV